MPSVNPPGRAKWWACEASGRPSPMARKPAETTAKRKARREPTKLLSVEIGGITALGGDVRVELEPRRTILVGRNAVGKSVLLEAIVDGMEQALRRRGRKEPHRFRIELDAGRGTRLGYEYKWRPTSRTRQQAPLALEPDEMFIGEVHWAERCWRDGERRALWNLRNTRLTVAGEAPVEVADTTSLQLKQLEATFHVEVRHLRHLFGNARLLPSGVPREDTPRQVFINSMRASKLSRYGLVGLDDRRIEAVLNRLLAWFLFDRATFNEIEELGRRLHIFRKLEVVQFKPDPKHDREDSWMSLSVDGVNAGLLSDGTQRVIEMLVQLLDTPPGGLLLIEEPETGIHPGMLAALLRIIESYSLDRQVVLSTHSPLLVSNSKPEELRLVERTAQGVTTVRKLSETEAGLVGRYLEHQGTLGDFVYSGGLDGEP